MGTQVQQDLEELDNKLNKDQVKAMSQECFKNLCKKQINKLALKYLQNKKERHNKVKFIKYEKLRMEDYLKAEEIQIFSACAFRYLCHVLLFLQEWKKYI